MKILLGILALNLGLTTLANAKTKDIYLQVNCNVNGQVKYLQVDKVIFEAGKLILQDALVPAWENNYQYKTLEIVDSQTCEVSASDYVGVIPGH